MFHCLGLILLKVLGFIDFWVSGVMVLGFGDFRFTGLMVSWFHTFKV